MYLCCRVPGTRCTAEAQMKEGRHSLCWPFFVASQFPFAPAEWIE
jgi:hypothetical protein